MEFRILGPVEIRAAGRSLVLGGPRQSALLAILLLNAGTSVPTSRIIDLLWPESAPKNAGAVQVYVSRLRAVLRTADDSADAPRLVTEPGGYALHLGDAEVDLARFRALVNAAADEPRAERTAELLRLALALWRSEALADLDGPIRLMAAGVEEARLQAVEDLAEIELSLGRHRTVVQDLSGEVRRAPLRERLTALLIRALDGSDRRPEALAAYEALRSQLAEEFGVDPSAPLRQLHLQLLRAGEGLPAPPGQAVPVQLPPMPSRFVGRVAELAAMDSVYQRRDGMAAPICAITGPGGVGKTATAVWWIRQAVARFPDGQLFVDLQGHDPSHSMSSADVLQRFLRTLGHAHEDIPPDLGERAARFRSVLAERRLVILLDNAASSAQVRPLLPGAAGCLTIVTSRNRLDGLVARDGAVPLRLGMLAKREAQELLVALMGEERIAQAPPKDLVQLAELCDGLPLALRIVAARLVIDDRLPIDLVREFADARNRLSGLDLETGDTTVRGAFAVSYAALPDQAAAVFRLLGLVPRTALPYPAAAALAGLSEPDFATAAGMLVDRHLVEAEDGRLRMHDLMRLFAAEQSGRPDAAALSRLTDWYIQHATTAQKACDPHRRTVPVTVEHPVDVPAFASADAAKAWFDQEAGNLLTLTRIAAEHGLARECWQLADAQYSYLMRAHALAELRESQELGLRAARSDGRPDAERLVANGLGVAYSLAHDFDRAIQWMEHAAGISAEQGSLRDQVISQLNIASAYGHKGDRFAAEQKMRQASADARRLDDRYLLCVCLGNLGWLLTEDDRLTEAGTCLSEALGLALEHGIAQQVAPMQVHLAHLKIKLGQHAEAAEHARAALAAREGDQQTTGRATYWLGVALEALGDHEQAIACWQEALALLRQIGSRDADFPAAALGPQRSAAVAR